MAVGSLASLTISLFDKTKVYPSNVFKHLASYLELINERMGRLCLWASLVMMITNCHPREKSPESLEKEVIKPTLGGLTVTTHASMSLKDLCVMANHYYLPLDEMSGVHYRVQLSEGTSSELLKSLGEKKYVQISKIERFSSTVSGSVISLITRFSQMNVDNQKDWEETVAAWGMEEQPSEKVFYTHVPEGQEVSCLKKLAQNPLIKWEEANAADLSEDESVTSSFLFVKDKGVRVR